MTVVTPSEALNWVRENQLLSMRQCADELGCTVSHIHNLVHNKMDPSWTLGQRIIEWAKHRGMPWV